MVRISSLLQIYFVVGLVGWSRSRLGAEFRFHIISDRKVVGEENASPYQFIIGQIGCQGGEFSLIVFVLALYSASSPSLNSR